MLLDVREEGDAALPHAVAQAGYPYHGLLRLTQDRLVEVDLQAVVCGPGSEDPQKLNTLRTRNAMQQAGVGRLTGGGTGDA